MNRVRINLVQDTQPELQQYVDDTTTRNSDQDKARGRIIKTIYNLVSHCLPCNSSHNVVNHEIGIMEAFSNVNIVAKLQEV